MTQVPKQALDQARKKTRELWAKLAVKDETHGGLKGVLVSIKGWMGMTFNVRANLTDGNRKDDDPTPPGLQAISASRRRLGRSSRRKDRSDAENPR